MDISLVIPGRNCERTIRACLDAVAPLLAAGQLREILFVDDGSTDATAEIVREYPVTLIHGQGGGAGAARNLGWRAAQGEWIWFIDSDCVAESDALSILCASASEPNVAGIGGSYANNTPESLVASLIHEEIVARHLRMPSNVDFLATFNVLYRRSALDAMGGFDERRYNGPGIAAAEDAELAFRLIDAGYQLRFDARSRVGHFHPTNYLRYLRVQQRHGFYRVRLYHDYPSRARGDSYSGLCDHVQPPLAILSLALLPLLAWPRWRWLPVAALVLLFLLQLPFTLRLVRRTQSLKYLMFAAFGFFRAFFRGIGMTAGMIDVAFRRGKTPRIRPSVELCPVDSPFVSVVVCVHNRPRQILECLESLVLSRTQDFEILVVDDASTDDTVDRVRAFADEHPERNIRVVALATNAGVSGARNAGIRAALGEVVLFTDSDCIVDPDWVERLAAPLRAGEASAASGWVRDPAPRNLCELSFFGNLTLHPGPWQKRHLAGCNMGFRRDVLAEHPFDEQLTYGCDEDDVARRLVAAGHRILMVPDATITHCHPMTLRPYLRQAFRQGRGSARYWFKHGIYVGRDVALGLLALATLPWIALDVRIAWISALLCGLQLGAVWFNEWTLKRLPFAKSIAVLPIAAAYNAVKMFSVVLTLARILLGREPQAWKSRTLSTAPRVVKRSAAATY